MSLSNGLLGVRCVGIVPVFTASPPPRTTNTRPRDRTSIRPWEAEKLAPGDVCRPPFYLDRDRRCSIHSADPTSGSRLTTRERASRASGTCLELSPDIIKLDIGIVRNIDTESSQRALASALVALRCAREIGTELIADGKCSFDVLVEDFGADRRHSARPVSHDRCPCCRCR